MNPLREPSTWAGLGCMSIGLSLVTITEPGSRFLALLGILCGGVAVTIVALRDICARAR